MTKANEHNLKKDDSLRSLFLATPGGGPPQPTVNLLLHHGVRSALEYARSGDLAKAHAARNPDMAPICPSSTWAGTATPPCGSTPARW